MDINLIWTFLSHLASGSRRFTITVYMKKKIFLKLLHTRHVMTRTRQHWTYQRPASGPRCRTVTVKKVTIINCRLFLDSCPHYFTGVLLLHVRTRSGELRTKKLKSQLVRTQILIVLTLKPRVGQYIAIHVTLTARNFFLAYFYPSGPFTCIFFQNSFRFLSCFGCG